MAESRVRVSMVDFIKAWQSSDSVKEVADKTGLAEGSVQARASKYRSAEFNDKGEVTRPAIPLKTMPRGGGARLQVDAAMALLAELNGQTVEQIQAEAAKLAEKKAERTAKREAAAAAAAAKSEGEGSEDTSEE